MRGRDCFVVALFNFGEGENLEIPSGIFQIDEVFYRTRA